MMQKVATSGRSFCWSDRSASALDSWGGGASGWTKGWTTGTHVTVASWSNATASDTTRWRRLRPQLRCHMVNQIYHSAGLAKGHGAASRSGVGLLVAATNHLTTKATINTIAKAQTTTGPVGKSVT